MNKQKSIFSRQHNVYQEIYANRRIKIFWKSFLFKYKQLIASGFKHRRRGPHINIGFVLDGGIGDNVLYGAYLEKFTKKLDCETKIYLFVRQPVDSIKSLFSEYEFGANIYPRHKLKKIPLDMIIRFGVQFPEVLFYRDKYISKKSKFLPRYENTIFEFNKRYAHVLGNSNIFSQQILLDIRGLNRIDGMDICGLVDLKKSDKITIKIPETAKAILEQNNIQDGKFITFSYGTDLNTNVQTSTRLWPADKFSELFSRIKSEFPDYKIVQLGTKSLSKIDGVDINLVGQTSFYELLTLLGKSSLHIDGECGMVHLRHALCERPSVVLLGPTSISTKGYPENINIRSKTCNCTCCEWLTGAKWQTFCPKTNTSIAPCMHTISVDTVFEHIKGVIRI